LTCHTWNDSILWSEFRKI